MGLVANLSWWDSWWTFALEVGRKIKVGDTGVIYLFIKMYLF